MVPADKGTLKGEEGWWEEGCWKGLTLVCGLLPAPAPAPAPAMAVEEAEPDAEMAAAGRSNDDVNWRIMSGMGDEEPGARESEDDCILLSVSRPAASKALLSSCESG
ncbi:hypothetical protein EV177_010401, partial [Coemansia sp. RSA 1804]